MDLNKTVVITEAERDELEKRFYELQGMKALIKDIRFLNDLTNNMLIDKVIEKYVLANTAFEMIWDIISHNHFTGEEINKPKACDFSTRTVTLKGGEE